MDLSSRRCVPCRGGVPPMTAEEAERYLADVPGWESVDAGTKIRRTFRFNDFAGALAFVERVAATAEQEGHHPDISFGWGYCTVVFQTHKIRGLHENDFIMASKVNALAG